MATRNVVLSQHQHELVESLVKSGRYQNASEVLRQVFASWSASKPQRRPRFPPCVKPLSRAGQI